MPRVDRDVGDAAAHQAGAEHGDLAAPGEARRRGPRRPESFLSAVWAKKISMRRWATLETTSSPKALASTSQRGGEPLVGPGLEHVDDALGGGVVAAGLLAQLGAGLLEEEAAAERVLLEGEAGELVLELLPPPCSAGGGRRERPASASFSASAAATSRRMEAGTTSSARPSDLALAGADVLAGEAVVERDLEADPLGEALEAVGAGEQAELHLGEARARSSCRR